jgi:hypothetical protein
VELTWLTGRLAPDFKTIADFRKDNGEAIRLVCREFVTLAKGKKEKSYFLQIVNPDCIGCNAVTLFFDSKRYTQARVNLDIKEEGYRFKGVVTEFVPSAYYVRNSESDRIIHISEKTYKRSNGAYPSEIFTDQELVNGLKAGNEASVSKYSEANWAFFLLNTTNYNKELLGISESVVDAQ